MGSDAEYVSIWTRHHVTGIKQNVRPIASQKNLGAKTKWRKVWLNNLAICYSVRSSISASFVLVMFTEIKRNMVLNFKQTWFIRMKQIFVGIPSNQILPLQLNLFAILFIALKLSPGDRWQIFHDISNELSKYTQIFYRFTIMADNLEVVVNVRQRIRKRYIPEDSIVYLWFCKFQTALFIHNTTRESCIKVTILGWCWWIESKRIKISNTSVQLNSTHCAF